LLSQTALATRLPRMMVDLEEISGLRPKRIDAYAARRLPAIATVLSTAGSAVPLRPPVHLDVGQIVTLLERVAANLRSGRIQIAPTSPEIILREVFFESRMTRDTGGRPMA